MVACKTVNEYHSNQRKLRRFYLEEQTAQAATIQPCRPNPVNTEPLEHADVVKLVRANQRKQVRPTRAKQNPKGKTRKADQNRAKTFAQKSKEAALKHSQSVRNDKRKLLYSSSPENKLLLKASPKQLQSPSTMKTFNIRETAGGTTFRITAYSDANNFMNSPSTSAATPGPSPARSTPCVDRIVDNIWERNSPKKQPENDNPIEVVYLDSSNSTGKQTHDIIHLESTPDDENDALQSTSNELVEGDQLDNNETEGHEGGPPSAISDIHPRDFYDPSEL